MPGCAELLFPGLIRKKNPALLASSAQMAIDSVVVMRVRMHCPTCVSDVTSCLLSLNGVVDVHADPSSSTVSVKGRALDPGKLSRGLRRKTRKRCEIVLAQALGGAATAPINMGMQHDQNTISTTAPCVLEMHGLAPLAGTASAATAVSVATTATTTTTASHNPEASGATPAASVVLDPSQQHPAGVHVLQAAVPQADPAQQHQLTSVHHPLAGNSAVDLQQPSAAQVGIYTPHESQQRSCTIGNAQAFYHYDESRKLSTREGVEPCLEIKQQIHSIVHGGWPPASIAPCVPFQPSPYHHYATAPDHYYIGYTASEPRYRYEYPSDENPDACHIM